MAGLTAEGFITTTTEEQRIALANALRANLGQDIDTNPSSRIGQFIDIIGSELESLWLGVEAVYDSQFIVSASGQALDNIGSVTNTPRKAGFLGSANLYFAGTVGTVVPLNFAVSSGGSFEFKTTFSKPIIDNRLLIICDAIPNSGSYLFDAILNGVVVNTFEILWNDTTSAISQKLATALSVDVSRFDVQGTLSKSGAVYIKYLSTSPADKLELTAKTSGIGCWNTTDNFITSSGSAQIDTNFAPHTITTIVNNLSGIQKVVNLDSSIPSFAPESDAKYRERLQTELSGGVLCSADGLVKALKELDGVTWAAIVENSNTTADAAGRPPFSIEVYVEGGDNNAIAQKIADLHTPSILIVSTVDQSLKREGSFIDWNQNLANMTFSSVDQVPIKIGITGTKSSIFPSDGNDQIKNAIVNYVNSLDIGEPLYSQNLYAVVNTIPGILTLNITAAKLSESLTPNAIIDPSFLKRLNIIASNINISLT